MGRNLFNDSPYVVEGLEEYGWSRIPFGGGFGYTWRDSAGNLFTEDEAAAWLARRRREKADG